MHVLAGLLLIFIYEVGAAVILPTPSEIPVFGYNYIPLGWIFLFAVLGKTVGSYIVFLGGAKAKETARFARFLADHEWAKRAYDWSERFVRRYGMIAVFAHMSIPGFPDTASIYLFAIVGRRPIAFALAAGLGTAVRMVIVLFAFHGIRQLAGS